MIYEYLLLFSSSKAVVILFSIYYNTRSFIIYFPTTSCLYTEKSLTHYLGICLNHIEITNTSIVTLLAT